MKQIRRIPITKEGFQNLQKELMELTAARPQAVKTLAEARAMGDLSENGLYTAAKAKLRSIDSQLFRLDIQIKLADIIESNRKDIVGIDSKVTVSNGDSKKTFHIVGDYEASPLEGKISRNSPLGKSLIGKKIDEIAEFQAPSGTISYKVVSIS